VNVCSVECTGVHSHDILNPIHLSGDQKTKFMKLPKKILELRHPKLSLESLGDFDKIQSEFEHHIIYIQIARKSEFFIILSSPKMTKYRLLFDTQPTGHRCHLQSSCRWKKNIYICSSMIYLPGLRKNVAYFQAIIGSLDAKYFARYFIQICIFLSRCPASKTLVLSIK
jgi:hypothetical protein